MSSRGACPVRATYEENVYFYGITGQRIGTYTLTDTSGTLALAVKETNIYFGGKVLKQGSTWVAMDRLASVRYRSGSPGERFDYWPYGEEKPTATTQDRDKFATYMRDHTNLDYADQRYYANGLGRFITSDPNRGGIELVQLRGRGPGEFHRSHGAIRLRTSSQSVGRGPRRSLPAGYEL